MGKKILKKTKDGVNSSGHSGARVEEVLIFRTVFGSDYVSSWIVLRTQVSFAEKCLRIQRKSWVTWEQNIHRQLLLLKFRALPGPTLTPSLSLYLPYQSSWVPVVGFPDWSHSLWVFYGFLTLLDLWPQAKPKLEEIHHQHFFGNCPQRG